MSVAAVAKELEMPLIGEDAVFADLSIDSRTLKQGDAFLALKGENFDGHDFISSAEDSETSALIVEQRQDTSLPQIVVENTHLALAAIARLNRRASQATVLAMTGSQGKTTVKEMVHSILAEHGSTMATAANLNNTIGVPLTLLRIKSEHEFAVIEMGADRIGEIAFSASATEPDIAIITCASPAHVEGFGSLEGIVEGKGEILDSLNEKGVAVLNGDDKFVSRWQQRASHCKTVLFGGPKNESAHYRATKIETRAGEGVCFELVSPQGSIDIKLQLLGEHNAINATAAAAAALEAGASLQEVQSGLAKLQPVAGRLVQVPGKAGSVIIDDTYNAGPSSFKAAIDVLSQFPGRRIVVAGDMKELGAEAESAHAEVGQYAQEKNIDELWVTGEFGYITAREFGTSAIKFETQEQLIAHCVEQVSAGDIFLVKGSRGSRMENIVAGLRLEGSEQC